MRKNILILISALLFSCSTETEKLDFELIFGNQTQEFLLLNDNDIVLKGEKGTVIKIPKELLSSYNKTDTLHFVLKEYYSVIDMIKAGLSTTSNGRLLESKGMISLKAFVNNQEVEIKKGSVDLIFAGNEFPENYQIFYGNYDNETINWNLDTLTKNYHVFYNYVMSGSGSETEDFVIDSIKIDSLLWNRNYSQVDTIGTYLESNDTIYDYNSYFEQFGSDDSNNNRIYRILPFQWINLDIFLELENLSNISIESNKINRPCYFCVFQKYNSILSSYENNIVGVPNGEIVSIIGIDFKDNEIYFDIKKEVVIEDEINISLNLKKVEESEIDSILSELDKK